MKKMFLILCLLGSIQIQAAQNKDGAFANLFLTVLALSSVKLGAAHEKIPDITECLKYHELKGQVQFMKNHSPLESNPYYSGIDTLLGCDSSGSSQAWGGYQESLGCARLKNKCTGSKDRTGTGAEWKYYTLCAEEQIRFAESLKATENIFGVTGCSTSECVLEYSAHREQEKRDYIFKEGSPDRVRLVHELACVHQTRKMAEHGDHFFYHESACESDERLKCILSIPNFLRGQVLYLPAVPQGFFAKEVEAFISCVSEIPKLCSSIQKNNIPKQQKRAKACLNSGYGHWNKVCFRPKQKPYKDNKR